MSAPLFHKLQSAEYGREARRKLLELEATRQPGRRRWLIAQIRRLRAREHWHGARVAKHAGDAVEALALEACWWIDDLHYQRTQALREKWLERFRRALRRAGDRYAAETITAPCGAALANSRVDQILARSTTPPKTRTPDAAEASGADGAQKRRSTLCSNEQLT